MKKSYSFIALALCLVFNIITLKAQTSGNMVFQFLKSLPAANITNCSGNDLMALLTDDAKEWVESIECENIDLFNDAPGAIMNLGLSDELVTSYIQINFKSQKLFKVTNVSFYCSNDTGVEAGTETLPVIYVNDKKYDSILSGGGDFKVYSDNKSLTAVTDGVYNRTGATVPPRIYVNGLGADNLLHNCKIEISTKDQHVRVPVYALKVFYSDIVVDENTSVAELINDADSEIKYYDLMGRELSDAPVKGIYIRCENGNAVKCISR